MRSAALSDAIAGTVDPFGNSGRPDHPADVLVIEDEIEMSESLCIGLRANGLNPVAAFSGEQGLGVLESRPFAVMLLDWRLPGCSGIDVLKTLRARDDRTPVFLMSVLDALEDRIFAFDHGADDYLVKPFALPELLARIRARLRRDACNEALQRRIGDLVLHVESRRAQRAGHDIALTPREFDLLLYLVQHQRQVVTREMLGHDVWRMARPCASLDNAIDVHIAHLRRKIDAAQEVMLIHTVRGEGFVASERPPAESSHPFLHDPRGQHVPAA